MRLSSRLFQKLFKDKVKLCLQSGNGANGNPKIGGKGGNGGSIFLVGNPKTKLEDICDIYPSFQIKASHGKEPTKSNLIGISGDNILINVPIGIEITQKSGDILGNIINRNDKMIVCRGGTGGGPLNNYMAQSGEKIPIVLNLKLIADVGLVGFPNAGKSSLLSNISGMTAKIANYPFTTLRPQVASIIYNDGRSISIADLPGIIEGAHVNVGLGHHFLKHVERTKLLLFVIDIYGFKLNSKSLKSRYRSPLETILLLNQELEIYNASLLDKPAICLLNKVDRTEGDKISDFVMENILESKLETWKNEEVCPKKLIKFHKVIPISAKTGYGMDEVRSSIRDCLDEIALQQIQDEKERKELDREFEESGQSFV